MPRLAAWLLLCLQLAVATAGQKPFRVVAFFTARQDKAHISFVHEANRWFPEMAKKYHFSYDSTNDWSNMNDTFLSRYQVVIFLDTRPDEPAQRAAFERYMKKGGGWMGFHFAAFALTPSDYPQNWDWYHNEFIGSGSYVSNTWRPTSAVLRVEDARHPATRNLPMTFSTAPNEWYRWSNDLRKNPDIDILLSIDSTSFPLGTGPKPHEIWHSGYYPVVWTNRQYRMIYFNMGHNDIDYENKTDKELSFTFKNEMEDKLIMNALLWLGGAGSRAKYSPTSAFTSYKGLVMAGYQGWFNAPEDGADRGWNHYNNHGKFEPGACKIDLWPEVSEYKKTYKTSFVDKDGKPCYVYSSYDESSTDLHFKWMKQYGVDGAFVQRFVSNIKSPVSLHHNNVVLEHAEKAAEKYHRAIAVMYDLSGMREGDDTTVIRDWKSLVDDLKVAGRGKKQTYLYHRGKPLVVLWGVGFNDHRAYGLKEVEKIMGFLQHDPVYGGCSIMLGVPAYWRDLDRDTKKDPHLLDVIRKADIVHPWFVGRYNEETYVSFKARLPDDIAWCRENKVDYVPTIFPGFSWHNMYNKSPMNQVPRNRGKFYWKQIAGAISSGAEMLYVAMFDEVDEGTAILKVSKNPPVGESGFVTFEEDVPSDYYLTLTGYAGKMLRKEIPYTGEILPLPL